MRYPSTKIVLATGFAMFSMFFGAGNIVFPLALGQQTQSLMPVAFLGLLITAVGVPFLGLIAMTLFDGDYRSFFGRLGKWPGFILAVIIMGLIGPFGAIPRCIALSYSTTKIYFPEISLWGFSAYSCALIFALTMKKNRLLDILGYVLTPALLLTLAIIIVKGIVGSQGWSYNPDQPFSLFLMGFYEGYQTMDLLGAFFFSSVIIQGLKNDLLASNASENNRILIHTALKASLLGAVLLALVYAGFSLIAALNSELLTNVPKDEMLAVLAKDILGHEAGLIATICVALACLTTAIALSAVFAEFLHLHISRGYLGYIPALICTLIIAFFISTLEFTGIANFLAPILQLCYPSLIVLCIANIAYKLTGFRPVQPLVIGTFILTCFFYGITISLT